MMCFLNGSVVKKKGERRKDRNTSKSMSSSLPSNWDYTRYYSIVCALFILIPFLHHSWHDPVNERCPRQPTSPSKQSTKLSTFNFYTAQFTVCSWLLSEHLLNRPLQLSDRLSPSSLILHSHCFVLFYTCSKIPSGHLALTLKKLCVCVCIRDNEWCIKHKRTHCASFTANTTVHLNLHKPLQISCCFKSISADLISVCCVDTFWPNKGRQMTISKISVVFFTFKLVNSDCWI